MATVFTPHRPEELSEIVRWAAANATPLRVLGRDSKAGLGRPVPAAHELSLAGFSGVSGYEPSELILTAGAGTPLAEIEALLAEHGQMLAFEPPDHARLCTASTSSPTGDAEQSQERTGTLGGTLGGTVASNLSGPRRFLAGAARDHFLGFRAVNGRGEAFKAGGRVVKNVTGFDLPKLLAGSWGTLAALWEVTVKVMPVPEFSCTLLVFGLDDTGANRLMSTAAASAHVVSGAAHLPAWVAARSAVVKAAGQAVTALRVEGPELSTRHRVAALKALLADGGRAGIECDELDHPATLALWREIRDLALLPVGGEREIWRLALPPASAPGVIAQLAKMASAIPWLQDQAGGALWLSCPAGIADAQLRSALLPGGGHATLWCASAARRAAVPVFHPQPPALAALTRRVKASFDPRAVLNPGRMYSDI
ncbi:MAG: FAD-binding protein [Porticoccaceae bacterium]